MKKVIVITILLANLLEGYSQSADHISKEKRLRFGFNLGINHSNLIAEGLPENALASNNVGYKLGLLADYKVSKILSLSPKAEVSFHDSQVNFSNPDGSRTRYLIFPISIDFSTHFVFGKKDKKSAPYFFLGPSIKIPTSKEEDNTTAISNRSDFALDFGIGLSKVLTYFNLTPELRYSYGFLDINQYPEIQSLNFHTVSFVINFIE